jgi:hypothetical protein
VQSQTGISTVEVVELFTVVSTASPTAWLSSCLPACLHNSMPGWQVRQDTYVCKEGATRRQKQGELDFIIQMYFFERGESQLRCNATATAVHVLTNLSLMLLRSLQSSARDVDVFTIVNH